MKIVDGFISPVYPFFISCFFMSSGYSANSIDVSAAPPWFMSPGLIPWFLVESFHTFMCFSKLDSGITFTPSSFLDISGAIVVIGAQFPPWVHIIAMFLNPCWASDLQ